MQIADVAIEIDYRLTVQLQDHAQHAMGGRMLRPHVEGHLGAVHQRMLSGGDFYLMHRLLQRSFPLPWGEG